MYIFEVVSDCELSEDMIAKHKDSFKALITKNLTDSEVSVRVASLKATASFLTSLNDSDTAQQYTGIINHLLATVVEALRAKESQGQQALSSLAELANTHPEIFKNDVAKCIDVFSQVMANKDFEDATRSSASEVLLTLAAQMPALMRKASETKTHLLPAIV